MKKKNMFLKVFAFLVTLGWMSDVKGQTCDFSYNNHSDCDVILTFNYYPSGSTNTLAHTDTLFANTTPGFFNISNVILLLEQQ